MSENTLSLTYERVISPGDSLHSIERAPLTELKKYVLFESGGGGGGGRDKPVKARYTCVHLVSG